MKYAGLFLLFCFNTFAFKSDQLILRGRVPASIDMVKVENSINLDNEHEIFLNVDKSKYRIQIDKENQHKIVSIIFH